MTTSAPEDSVYEAIKDSPFQPLRPDAPVETRQTPIDDADAAPEGGAPEATDEPAREFDPRHAEAFTGLLYLGRLTREFTLWGHRFVVRTMTTEDSAQVGLLCRDYEGTRAASAVYQTAVVAAAVVSVDGQPLPQPLGPDPSAALMARYRYVADNWMPPVRERVWDEVFLLEEEVRRVLDEMGKASG